MKFALIGDHPDGLSMARALVESGRHELLAYCGPTVGAEYLRVWSLITKRVGDVEEVLADPAVEAVIVAGSPAERPSQLRRAVQAERHVLCVHPADEGPDVAHEAAMIQAETRKVVMPLLPEALHPGVRRLAELSRAPAMIEIVRASPERVLLEAETEGTEPAIPGWDLLRRLGGEIVEVVGLAEKEELDPDKPTLLMGRFEHGGLFRVTSLPFHTVHRWEVSLLTSSGRLELSFSEGWPGPALLVWTDESGEPRRETWEAWSPWFALVEQFERGIGFQPVREDTDRLEAYPTWRDEVRSLELDVAARRSIERRRTSTLEYQEATEEASFKGTMTLVGCGLLWASLALLIVSVWVPQFGWAILPVFAIFLILQLLRWIVPGAQKPEATPSQPPASAAEPHSASSSAIRSRK